MSKRHAPREAAAQQALDPGLKTEDSAERADALEQLRGNQFARDALVVAAVATGPIHDAKGILEIATDFMREEGAPEAELGGGEGDGGKAQLDPKEDPPADLDDVAERIEDMADNGVPPEMPDDEGGGEGGDDAPVMRSANGGGDDVDPEEVRPLIDGSTGSPLAASIVGRLGRVLDHSLDHVMVHTDGKAAEAAEKVHAHAFALGTHIFFAGGRYQPGTPGGDELLLHELTHVAQYDHGQLRGSSTGDLEVSKPGESAEMVAEAAAADGVTALRAADQGKPEAQVIRDDKHPIGRGSRPENQPMKRFMRGPVLETGVIFREEGEGQEGGDENWVVAKVREHAPALADVLTSGFEPIYGTDIIDYAAQWVVELVPDIDLQGLFDEVFTGVKEAAQLLADAARGDMACCERIGELAQGSLDALAAFRATGGPLDQLLEAVDTDWLGNLAGDLADKAAAGFMELMESTRIADMVDQAILLIDLLSPAFKVFVDNLLEQFNLPKLDEIPKWIEDKIQEVIDDALASSLSMVDALAESLASLQIVQNLAAQGDVLVELAQAASYLYEHWQDPEKFTDEELSQRFEHLGSVMDDVQVAFKWVMDTFHAFGDAAEQVQKTLQGLVSNPLFGLLAFTPLAAAIPPLLVLAYAGDGLFTEVWNAVATVGSWLGWAAGILAEVAVAATNIVNPFAWFSLLLGGALTAVSLLPDCYQEPIIDLFVEIAASLTGIVTVGMAASVPGGEAVHVGVQGFFDQLLGKSTQQKTGALYGLGYLFRLGFLADFAAGALLGALKGLWGVLVDIAVVVGAILAFNVACIAALPAFYAAICVLAKLVVEYDEGRQAEGDEDKDPLDGNQRIDDMEKGEPGFDAPDLDPGSITDMPDQQPGTWSELSDMFGAAWELVEQGAKKTGELMADGLVTMISNAELVAFTFGEWSGWLLTLGLIEYFTGLALAKFAVWLARGGAWLAKTVAMTAKLDDVLLRLAGPLKSVAGIVDDALEQALVLCRALNMPFVDELVGILGRLQDGIARFFDDVLEKLDEWAAILIKRRKEGQKRRKERGDDPEGVPGGKPGGGMDNRTKCAKLASQQAWTALRAATTGDLEDLDGLKKLLKRQDERILGEKIDYAIDVDQGAGEDKDTWGVRAYAGGIAEKDKSHKEGDGWVAEPHDDVDGSKERMYGATSAHSTNEAKADELLDAFEAAWQELCTDVDGKEHKEVEAQAARLADAVDAKLPYRELDIAYDFSKHEYGEDSTIKAKVVIAPNATKASRVLHAEVTDLERLAAEKAAEADRKLAQQVDDRLAPANDMKDLTNALDETVSANGTTEGTTVDIETVDRPNTWRAEATVELGDDKATKTSSKDHWRATDHDDKPYYGDKDARDTHIQLMEEMLEDIEELWEEAVFTDASEAMRQLEDFAREASAAAAKDAPYPNPTPDIRVAYDNLDLEEGIVDAKASWSPNVGVVTDRLVRRSKKASEVLQIAVEKAKTEVEGTAPAIVKFLASIAEGRSHNGVGRKQFSDAGHDAGWDRRSPSTKKKENKAWVKARFRSADSGKHEWVPMKNLGTIIGDAATDATRAGEWVHLAHSIRSKTSDLVYEPAPSKKLTKALDEVKATNPDDIPAAVQASGITAHGADVLSGHVGALYIEKDDEKLTGRTKGSFDFHRAINKTWSFNKDPDAYVGELVTLVEQRLWDGDVEKLLTKRGLVEYANPVPSDYRDSSGGKVWGDTLEAVGEAAEAKRLDVVEDLTDG